MKKIMVCGCGAQGSTICRKLDQEPNVTEIICADYNFETAKNVASMITKGKPKQVNAAHVEEIVAAAEDAELIINVMPLDFGINVLEAAIQCKCCYQDLSACEGIGHAEDPINNWLEGIRIMYTDYSKRFADNGTTALVGTGSSPGLMCVVARRAVQELDECDTLCCLVYEGVETKKFVPFWWSVQTALCDMEETAYAVENGIPTRRVPFSKPIVRRWPEYDYKPITLCEHAHEEPAFMGFHPDEYFKGAKNIFFKYGGGGVEFAKPLYKAGLLSHEPEMFDGHEIVPFDLIHAHVPEAPKNPEEIKAIIDEGVIEDGGAFVCEAYGKKNGRDVMIDLHVQAPGLIDSFERAKMSGEMYLTGQGAFLFTKLFVNDMIDQKGLITSDMLEDRQVEQYLEWAKELDITYTIDILENRYYKEDEV